MQSILIWLGKYNISTHTLGIVALALTAAFERYKPFHDLVTGFYTGLPTPVQVLIGTGGFLYALYKTGTLASSKEPSAVKAAGTGPQKLGALMLCAVLVSGLFSSGCSGITVAQDIVNWTPALQSAVATVDSTAALLAPVDAPIFAAATLGFDTLSDQVVTQAKAYLANPSLPFLQQLQAQVVTFQQSVNAGLLKLAGIKDAASQAHALTVLNGVAAVINVIFGLIAGVKGNTIAATATTVSFDAVKPYLDRQRAVELMAAHYGETPAQASAQLAVGQARLVQAGF